MMTEATVRRIVGNFKSVSGINNVNKNVLGFALDVCPQKIVDLINVSLKSGIYPDELRYTIVSPIPKVKNTNKPEEMRPINESHVIDKVMQTFVKEELEDHIRVNDLIHDYQSVYRAKPSCETALNLVIGN